MSKRIQSKSLKETELAPLDIILPDDVWTVIASCLPWYSIKTLLNFTLTCRDAILWIRPCVKRLVSVLRKPFPRQTYSDGKYHESDGPYCFLLHTFDGSSLKLFDVVGDDPHEARVTAMIRSEIPYWQEDEVQKFRDCLSFYSKIEESKTTSGDIKTWTRSLLSVLYCIYLRYLYIKGRMTPPSGEGLEIPLSTPLAHLFYRSGTDRYQLIPLPNLPNILICEGMHANLSKLIECVKTSIKNTHGVRERDIIHIALSHPDKTRVRDVCATLLSASLQCRQAEPTDTFDMAMLKVYDKEERDDRLIYLHGEGNALVKEIRNNCFYYRGPIRHATIAVHLQSNVRAHQERISLICDSIGGSQRVLRKPRSPDTSYDADEPYTIDDGVDNDTISSYSFSSSTTSYDEDDY